MATKYQFFTIPNSDRKKFTFLDMASETFLIEKAGLLEQGFEIEDDVILAESADEAVEKYKSNFTYVMEDYNASTNVFYTLYMMFKSLFTSKKNG